MAKKTETTEARAAEVRAHALKNWSQEDADMIAAIYLETGDDYKTCVRKMQARKEAAKKATVKNVSLTAEEKNKKDSPDQRRVRAEKYSAQIVKEVGKFADSLEEMDKINAEIQDAKERLHEKQETFADKVKNSSDLREKLQYVREYFAHKPTDELFLGKYKTGPDWAEGEIGVRYNYICRKLNEVTAKTLQGNLAALLLGEGKAITVPGTPVNPDKAAERQAKAIKSAVNKVLSHSAAVPEYDAELLASAFTKPKKKVVVEKEINLSDDLPQGITATAISSREAVGLPEGAPAVRGTTAFVVDIYGGTRVSIRDVDHSLLTVPVILDIFRKFVHETTGHLSNEDRNAVLRSYSMEIEDLLNNGTMTESNPTEEMETVTLR